MTVRSFYRAASYMDSHVVLTISDIFSEAKATLLPSAGPLEEGR